MKHFLVFISILFLTINLQAQRSLKKANRAYDQLKFQKAIKLYKEAINTSMTKEAVIGLGNSYRKVSEYENAYKYYRLAEEKKFLDEEDKVTYAEIMYDAKKYQELDDYLKLLKRKRVKSERLDLLTESVEHKEEMIRDSIFYGVSPYLTDDNYAYYGLTFYDEGMIVVSNHPASKGGNNETYTGGRYFDLFSTKNKQQRPLNKQINSDFHESSAVFCKKTKTLYFTRSKLLKNNTLSKNNDDINNFQIYSVELESFNTWGKPKLFPFSNEKYSIGHPAITADGNQLFFVSDQEGGEGLTDIYVSKKVDGKWTTPQNLGKVINSPGREMFPTIDEKDGKINLYFSSDYGIGLGGLDIYVSTYDSNGWSKPKHLTYPLNSSSDDFGLVFENESTGYLSSNRSENGIDGVYYFQGLEQLFYASGTIIDENNVPVANAFVDVLDTNNNLLKRVIADENGTYFTEIPPNAKTVLNVSKRDYPNKTKDVSTIGLIRGDTLYNNIMISKKPVFYARVSFIDKDSKEVLDGVTVVKDLKLIETNVLTSDKNGVVLVKLNEETDYDLTGKADQYFLKHKQITTRGKTKSDTVDVVFALEKLEVNKAIRLDNIYYDLGKWNIRNDAKASLNELVETLKENPTIVIELSSHTDARGSSTSNKRLSQKRASSAVDYLVVKGIDRKRLVATGYGEDKLLNNCSDGVKCSEEDHQFNRRTEFKIISK